MEALKNRPIYIDDYYPLNAVLAYMYPAGVDLESKFTNTVPPWIEELVAARILASCMNPDGSMKALCFDATTQSVMQMMGELGYPVPDESRILRLPAVINAELSGNARNEAIANALIQDGFIEDGSFFMAQALIRGQLSGLYAPGAADYPALGDKSRLNEMFDEDQLPERYRAYQSGAEFLSDNINQLLPCVVKLANSSSGDGVQVCLNPAQLRLARERFGNSEDTIVIDEFKQGQNSGILLGRKPDGTIDLIGWNEQVTDENGEYLSGIIRPGKPLPQVYQGMNRRPRLQKRLRDANYTGLFGFDGIDGGIIDPNLRPVAPAWIIMQAANGMLGDMNAFTFNGRLTGGREQVQKILRQYAKFSDPNSIVRLAALVETQSGFNVNGAILFDQNEALAENIATAQRMGFSSSAFDRNLKQLAA